MKAISVKVSGISLNSVQSVLSFVAAHRLHFAVSGAAAAFFGAILSADPVMFVGAAMAIAAVRPENRKGGEL